MMRTERAFDQLLMADHRECDRLLAAALDFAHDGNWLSAQASFGRFRTRTQAHFHVEEKVLFPEFEQLTGMRHGPTEVMRSEHAELRTLIEQCGDALDARDANALIGHGEAMLILLQQHNLKEEGVLYPSALGAAGPGAGALSVRIGDGLAAPADEPPDR